VAKVILFKPEVRRTAQEAAFPLVDKTLDETLALSRRYVPVRKPRQYDRRATGRLKKSLRKRGPKRQITQVQGSVGSTRNYAMAVHEGAVPHVIVAKRPNLVFYWEKMDVTFVGKRVNHPGVRRSSRKQYLYLPLVLVGRKNGFIVRRNTTGIASPLP
jgi:hypothetical protein